MQRAFAAATAHGFDAVSFAPPAPRQTALLSAMARTGVFIAVAASGVVFSEPAPVDLVMMGLILLLPLSGLQRYAPGMLLQFLLWLGCGIGALLAASVSREIGDSARHTAISFYLYGMFLVLAAFIAARPSEHTHLVLKAWVAAALIAALAGLAGYFSLVPGAFEIFTRYGRASGTFKDPNVLGPFLVPPILYLAHRILHRIGHRPLLDLAGMGVLAAALVLTFSRGAWINLATALGFYGAMTLVTLSSAAARARLVLLAALGGALALVALVAALQLEDLARLLAERSALTQGYDVGPQGRFGGQEKALGFIIANPLGLGARQFAPQYHPEDPHNVYLSMFLNAGWLGGLLYIAAVATTIVAGLAHVARGTATRPLFLVALAAFLANVVEGFVVDTDHWRHFYVLLAIVWGLMAVGQTAERGGVR